MRNGTGSNLFTTISLNPTLTPTSATGFSNNTKNSKRRPKTPKTTTSKKPSFADQQPGGSGSGSAQSLSFSVMRILTPRSATFDRLENGMGVGRGGPRSWPLWKKVLVGIALLSVMIWVFKPRHHDSHSDFPSTEPSSHPPLTFETDTDPSKTPFCTVPYSSDKPLVQYALIIDAGSTGSRIHIYKFNNCGPTLGYEYEVFKQLNPGLSDYASNPSGAAQSLDPLLNEAMRVVPPQLRKCTPVSVKATAGLRLLEARQSEEILEAVERRLRERYPFPLKDPNPVVILDGKEEGVYAWITANYLLGNLGAATSTKKETYAVLDLGGGSTQIVFEPKFPGKESGTEEGEHKYRLDFGGRKYELYQHSYLGYGLMSARKSVHRVVAFMDSIRAEHTQSSDIPNPCLNKGTTRTVEIESSPFFDETTPKKHNVTMSGIDVGSFEACKRVIELVIAKDAICQVKPCSFNGVYQPSLLDTFPTGRIMLLSYFYDRIQPLLPSPSPQQFEISSIATLASQVCEGPSSWASYGLTRSAEVKDDLIGRPEYCLDLTFMYVLLKLGYELDDAREVMLGKQLQGTELGWCLGAVIAEVLGGGSVKCLA